MAFGEVATSWSAVTESAGYTLYRRLPGETALTSVGTTAGTAPTVTAKPQGVELELAVTATGDDGEGLRRVPEEITL